MKVSTSMEAEELHDLCKGKIQWRKCQDCDVDGFQWRKCKDRDVDGFQYRNDHASDRVCKTHLTLHQLGSRR